MEAKFTKGEFAIDYTLSKVSANSNVQWISVKNSDYCTIAEFKGQHYGIPESEMHANTKLFFAAPELYYSLCAIIDTLEENISPDNLPLYSEIQDAKKAIKKATE